MYQQNVASLFRIFQIHSIEYCETRFIAEAHRYSKISKILKTYLHALRQTWQACKQQTNTTQIDHTVFEWLFAAWDGSGTRLFGPTFPTRLNAIHAAWNPEVATHLSRDPVDQTWLENRLQWNLLLSSVHFKIWRLVHWSEMPSLIVLGMVSPIRHDSTRLFSGRQGYLSRWSLSKQYACQGSA